MAYNRTHWDRGWTSPRARYKAEQRAKKRAERLHYHSCDGCPSETKFACTDYHCKNNKKRLCGVCRRAKKYHYVEPDLFASVAAAAKAVKILKRDPSQMIAVHMESHWEPEGIVHTYFAMWEDGTRTQMTQEEIGQWATESTTMPPTSATGATGS